MDNPTIPRQAVPYVANETATIRIEPAINSVMLTIKLEYIHNKKKAVSLIGDGAGDIMIFHTYREAMKVMDYLIEELDQ